MLILTWPSRQFVKFSEQCSISRVVSFGLLGVLSSLVVFSFLIWACIIGSKAIFDNLLMQVITSIAFIGLGSLIALPLITPLITLIMFPIVLILSIPLDILFPKK
jgi:hypothetical protein